VAVQFFHIIDAKTCTSNLYRNTTTARSEDEYRGILRDAGFQDIEIRNDWPSGNEDLMLITAYK